MLTLQEIGEALQGAHRAGDVQAAKRLAAAYEAEAAKAVSARSTAPLVSEQTAVEGSGGAAFGVYPSAASGKRSDGRATGDAALAIGLMAPAKAIAGLHDLPRAAHRGVASYFDKPSQLPGPEEDLGPKVEALTELLAGGKVGESIGRSAAEGVITGPMGGARLASAVPAMVAGGVGGGVTQGMAEAGLPWWAQLAGGAAAGGGAGFATRAASGEASLATDRLRKALEGTTEKDMRSGAAVHETMRERGLQGLPSQTMSRSLPSLQRLEAELIASRTQAGDDLRTRLGAESESVREQLRGLKGRVRSSDEDLQNTIILAADWAELPPAKLKEVLKRKELVRALIEHAPGQAQQIVQRHVNRLVDDALALRTSGGKAGMEKEAAGVRVAAGVDPLYNAPEAKVVDSVLAQTLFRKAPDPEAAAEGFRRAITALAAASKPTADRVAPGVVNPSPLGVGSTTREAFRSGGFVSQLDHTAGLAGRSITSALNSLSDKQVLAILSRPDMMERLIYISKLPPSKVTSAVMLSVLPQLQFEEEAPR